MEVRHASTALFQSGRSICGLMTYRSRTNGTATYATARITARVLAALKIKRNELLWICRHLDTRACHGVNMEVLLKIAQKRQNLRGATTAAQRVVDIGRPWLRFLGWWREPTVVFQYQDELDRYIEWMRDDRGFTPSTVEQWARIADRFLCWCERTNRQLGDLQAGDIDDYFATQGMGRWSRVSVANIASALRGFLALCGNAGNVRG